MGLLGTVVKSAVVSGTASAVHGRVPRRQAEKFQGRDANIAANRGAGWTSGAQSEQRQVAAPRPASSTDATIERLTQLGDLRDQGILTDEEFEVQKAKVLGV
jgi:hypothetical protein